FNVEYFFADSHGPGFGKSFYGPVADDFIFTNNVVAESVVWSACGAEALLRTETSMYVATNFAREQAMATVDSADVSASVIYQLQWRRCGAGQPPLPNPGPAPGYPPAPQPQPTPLPGQPGSYYGNCRIDADPYAYGQFLVRSRYQDLIGRAYSYPEAVRLAEQADRDGRCLGNGGYPQPQPQPTYPPQPYPQPYPPAPYPPYPPQPYPQPYPPAPYPPYPPYPPGPGTPGGGGGQRYQCSVTTARSTYWGSGHSTGQALAAARDACLLSENNSRVCNAARSACR
ncbi:MAG TPA: DUF4360 domain-containing protein, partial [Bdellovibrionota bacterium]|nr:DUF4360 domain-containing protein [Bdellovibrionota bacterium]